MGRRRWRERLKPVRWWCIRIGIVRVYVVRRYRAGWNPMRCGCARWQGTGRRYVTGHRLAVDHARRAIALGQHTLRVGGVVTALGVFVVRRLAAGAIGGTDQQACQRPCTGVVVAATAEHGILLPRTDATLLNNKEYDEFHLAGYGIAGLAAINFTFFNSFFIQSELKGGFIDMPDIRTTINKTDKASQQFWFRQTNVAFGANIRLARKNK